MSCKAKVDRYTGMEGFMKTVRLYEADGHLAAFEATVLSCAFDEKRKEWATVLDKTAFFPEGGGQGADTGILGDAKVLHTSVFGGVITHHTDRPLAVGEIVHGEIDYSTRFRRMQNHSGEHIVSGIVHSLFGYDNVGFHLGDSEVTLDFSGELTRADLDRVEQMANEAVFRDLPVTVSYPTPNELSTLQYRSKLDLSENVRIVTVEGYDTCACCAPHVSRTGEIGIIKLLDCIRYKGGSRLSILCGESALLDYRRRYTAEAHISRLLSVRQEESAEAVDALLAAKEELAREVSSLKRRIAAATVQDLRAIEGNRCLILDAPDSTVMREAVNLALPLATGVTVALAPDGMGAFRYVIGSRSVPLRSVIRKINEALGGRGGGRDEMVEGIFFAEREEIERYFAKTDLTVG
jgi:alanyl-tRNA synthetase